MPAEAPHRLKPEPDKLEIYFYGVLHVSAGAFLVFSNFHRLWLPLLLCGIFSLASLIQQSFGLRRRRADWLSWAFILGKYTLAGLCLSIAEGPGTVFLLYILELDICFSFSLLVSGLLSSVVLGTVLWFATVVSGSDLDVIIMHVLAFTAIYLLAHTVKSEQELNRTRADNIADLHSNEKKLQEMNHQMQQFSNQLEENAKLQERSRIAKGIHDTLGHTLTAIIVQLSAAEQVFDKEPAIVLENIHNAHDQARIGLDKVRQTIQMLDVSGASLAGQLDQVIRAAEKSLQIKVLAVIGEEISGRADVPEAEYLRQILLSCLREGLTNGVRHGRATAFLFKVERVNDQIEMYLEDNGTGCTSLVKGYGLTAMEEMVEQAGGSFDAASILGEGFYLRITLPADPPALAGQEKERH